MCWRRKGKSPREQVKSKPPQAIAKIVEGKLEKFYQGYCLLDQGFVKKNSEVTVKEHRRRWRSSWVMRFRFASLCGSRWAKRRRDYFGGAPGFWGLRRLDS